MPAIIRHILLIIFAALVAPCLSAQDVKPYRGVVKDGYNFWLYTPPSMPMDTARAKPLIVFLHGASLCGNNLDRVRRYGTIDAISMGRKPDAYVVAPQNPGGSWSPRRVMNVIDWVEAHNDVDTNRVYVLGMSLGGYGTIDVAATYPDKIAAAIAICGGASVKDLSRLKDVPLWIIHGTADRAVPISQSDRVVAAIRSSQAEARAAARTDTVFTDATHSEESRLAYDRVKGMNHGQPARFFYLSECYDWLLSHSLLDEGRAIAPTFTVDHSTLKEAYKGLNTRARVKGATGSTKKKGTKKKSSRRKRRR